MSERCVETKQNDPYVALTALAHQVFILVVQSALLGGLWLSCGAVRTTKELISHPHAGVNVCDVVWL